MSTRDQFAVVRLAQGWRILFDRRWRGRIVEEVDAVYSAMGLAGAGRRAGRSPRVLVQGRWGEMRSLDLPATERDARPSRDGPREHFGERTRAS